MKFLKIFADRKYFRIFLRFPINSLLSFVIRFFSLYFLVDIYNFDYTLVYITTYSYIIFQSYLLQKYFVQKSMKSNFILFLFSNIVIGIFEYALIYFLQIFFSSYYSYMLFVAAAVVYLLRFYIYTFKIFKS